MDMWTLFIATLLANIGSEGLDTLALDQPAHAPDDSELLLLHEPSAPKTDAGKARATMLEHQKQEVRQLYAGLFDALHLDEQQTESLTFLIAEHALATKTWSVGTFHFRPTSGDEARALEYLAQIKSLLGVERFTLFEEYRATVPERVHLRKFVQNLALAGHPLTNEQLSQLVAVLNAQREKLKTHDSNSLPDAVERAEQTIRLLDEIDRSLEEHFTELLSPEQNEVALRHFAERMKRRHAALDHHKRYVAEGGSPVGFSYPAD
jgi:hypothetical protein